MAPSAPKSLARLAVTIGLVSAIWWPIVGSTPDGFPLSTYPMFSYPRASRSRVDTVLGVEADGRRRPLTPWHIGGTSRPKQALATAIDAVQQRQTASLCRLVATRLVAQPLPTPIVALEVVTETWDTPRTFETSAALLQRRVHTRCELAQ